MEILPKHPEASFKMYELISGYWVAACIHAVAKMDIADHLATGKMSITELAQKTASDTISLRRLMRAVTSVGIFEEVDKDVYMMNQLGETLRTNVPGSIKPWALANLGEHYPAFGQLAYSVRTGNVAFDYVHGTPVWEYYKNNPAAGENLAKAMAGVSGAVLKGVVDNYDFSPYKVIVDLGGGNGAMLFTLLEAAPNAKGIVFDEPYVAEKTAQNIPEHLQNRCTAVGGNFFEKVPADADLYVTKWVLHDWSDEEVIQILKVTYEAMPVGAKLLIIDAVIPDEPNKAHAGKLLDINIMALTTGKERTLAEFKHVIEQAGLTFTGLIQAGTEISSMVECQKLA